MEICPDCGSDMTRRIARTWWMRLFFPASVHIQCAACGETSLIKRSTSGIKY
jgi:predicted RNA-binding Zn-ribbon protein involved in translation (DUF1610 family)